MSIDLNYKHKKVNEISYNFCRREIKRRDLEKLAKKSGWSIRRGGSEPLVAYLDGYPSVSIPGHGNNAVIKRGLLLEVTKRLIEPLVDKEIDKLCIQELILKNEELENNIKEKNDINTELASWKNILEAENWRLISEVEISIQLANETEQLNRKTKFRFTKLVQRYVKLKENFKNLLLKTIVLEKEKEKIIQDFEEINIQVKQLEMGSANTLKQLIRFRKTLDHKNREKLNRIISYLQEQI